MPELPEVEWAAAELRRRALGKTIAIVKARPGPPLVKTAPRQLTQRMVGRLITAIERKGKQLVLRLDDGAALLLHLGMTGRIAGEDAAARLQLAFRDGSVTSLVDTRRLGRVSLVAGSEADRQLGLLGPDAMAARPKEIVDRLLGARGPIKVVLLDQARVAGIGNIYAIEGLFRAGIDPRTSAAVLGRAELGRLVRAVRASMKRSLDRPPTSDVAYLSEGAENRFAVYGRAGSPCPRCHTVIQRLAQGGRSTFYCPTCQASGARKPGRATKVAWQATRSRGRKTS